ncbi:Ser/Thr protein phosphatase [Tritrichomonas foetus]|uniref:Serine/threonine-protein phosphatase n=1 Tax=Tritrichomonas foetus TaxID=1144522 RepID=A0A1J4KB17_9EUKA|nr:Ser/Thr protein phosphatase [Tritrichomonas foetus]|eukprot:OHT08411.1 Ser/Thr protein phosphatase [Tritrichomonas foetus]
MEIANHIVNIYSQIWSNLDLDTVSNRKNPLHFPMFSPDDLGKLCAEARHIFESEEVSLSIDGPVTIIGDLHGHILDLFRDLQIFGLPNQSENHSENCASIANTVNYENNNNGSPNEQKNSKSNQKYLFLGDLVDRGEFSTETVSLVFALKVKYPKNVFVIRGNHEFSFLNQRCGFQDELSKIYGPQSTSLYDKFLAAFTYIPITALINGQILCVHGGLGPNWFSLNQAKKIIRPVEDFGDEVQDAMLWSDPNETIDFYEPSNRGTGFLFGKSAVDDFSNDNNIKLIVRAHECVNNGINFMFDNRLVTVFGASNYCGLVSNKSGVLQIDSNGDYSSSIFPPLFYLKRDQVNFMMVVDGKLITLNKRNIPESMSTIQLPKYKPNIQKLPPLVLTGAQANGRKSNTPHSDPRTHRPLINTGRPRWGDSGRPPIRIPR